MSLQVPQVLVDAEILWFLLQGYKGMLDNECGSRDLDKWRTTGFYSPEYTAITLMEEQIKELL